MTFSHQKYYLYNQSNLFFFLTQLKLLKYLFFLIFYGRINYELILKKNKKKLIKKIQPNRKIKSITYAFALKKKFLTVNKFFHHKNLWYLNKKFNKCLNVYFAQLEPYLNKNRAPLRGTLFSHYTLFNLFSSNSTYFNKFRPIEKPSVKTSLQLDWKSRQFKLIFKNKKLYLLNFDKEPMIEYFAFECKPFLFLHSPHKSFSMFLEFFYSQYWLLYLFKLFLNNFKFHYYTKSHSNFKSKSYKFHLYLEFSPFLNKFFMLNCNKMYMFLPNFSQSFPFSTTFWTIDYFSSTQLITPTFVSIIHLNHIWNNFVKPGHAPVTYKNYKLFIKYNTQTQTQTQALKSKSFFSLNKINNNSNFTITPSDNTFVNICHLLLNNSNLSHTTPQIYYYTKFNTAFRLSFYGFIFLTNFDNNIRINKQYDFKKSFYSFFHRYELFEHVLYSYNYTAWGKNVSISTFSDDMNNVFTPLLNSFEQLRSTPSYKHLFSINDLNLLIQNEKIKNNYFKDDDDYSLAIKRVKFKPGYMRIWREKRESLKFVYKLKFTYQFNLTRYIIRLRKIIKNKLMISLEMRIINVLLSSRLFFCYASINDAINSELVYINGNVVSLPSTQLFANDFLQLIVHLKFYLFYKYAINNMIKKRIKLQKFFYHRYKSDSVSVNKTKNKYMPQWVLNYQMHDVDTLKYLEIDFFSLSLFVIYEPQFFRDFLPTTVFTKKTGVLNLYNWKYIT